MSMSMSMSMSQSSPIGRRQVADGTHRRPFEQTGVAERAIAGVGLTGGRRRLRAGQNSSTLSRSGRRASLDCYPMNRSGVHGERPGTFTLSADLEMAGDVAFVSVPRTRTRRSITPQALVVIWLAVP
jgi:hypothetical protein